nr:guanine nucleotide exchange factor DBS-like isoform X4 [Biomphalaria glabrata]
MNEYVIIESKDEPPGSAMDETSQQYKVIDVAPLLQTKYAVLSGGKAKNGAPIMTFPSRPSLAEVSDEDYGKVVTYLCGITPLHESEAGFVIVIDRRQDSWGAVKAILLKLSAFFPVHIQVVFLLQPKGFFQRAFADFRSKFVKEELEFKVVLCDATKDIEDYVEVSNLTSDVGGELEFDANEWTEHRSAVEKFSKNTAQISTNLSAVVKKMEERELPNDVTGTEAILRVCMAERKELLEDIDSASAHGETLLKCIKGDNPSTPLTKLCHVLELERLLVQLHESRTGFGEFWLRHEAKLKQCLTVRKFEEEFKLIQFTMERRQETLEAQMNELGSSVMLVEQLIHDFDQLEEASQLCSSCDVQLCSQRDVQLCSQSQCQRSIDRRFHQPIFSSPPPCVTVAPQTQAYFWNVRSVVPLTFSTSPQPVHPVQTLADGYILTDAARELPQCTLALTLGRQSKQPTVLAF